jgi:hypothetical protein
MCGMTPIQLFTPHLEVINALFVNFIQAGWTKIESLINLIIEEVEI